LTCITTIIFVLVRTFSGGKCRSDHDSEFGWVGSILRLFIKAPAGCLIYSGSGGWSTSASRKGIYWNSKYTGQAAGINIICMNSVEGEILLVRQTQVSTARIVFLVLFRHTHSSHAFAPLLDLHQLKKDHAAEMEK
jgi:hypothetical protein